MVTFLDDFMASDRRDKGDVEVDRDSSITLFFLIYRLPLVTFRAKHYGLHTATVYAANHDDVGRLKV